MVFCGPSSEDLGLPQMLAVENAPLHEYFESVLRSWRPSSPRSAALLLQTVSGELNDKLVTSNAMRRKLAHGIGLVLQQCGQYVHTHTQYCPALSTS